MESGGRGTKIIGRNVFKIMTINYISQYDDAWKEGSILFLLTSPQMAVKSLLCRLFWYLGQGKPVVGEARGWRLEAVG